MKVFITGVSRGIGLSLTRKALKEGHEVYGVARQPKESKDLIELAQEYPSLHILEIDLREAGVSQKISDTLSGCKTIDVLINNAGLFEKGSGKEEFLKSFEVNAYIPYMMTEILLPKLKNSSTPKLVHITSLMGSITDNTSGSAYAYRASKAALNMIHKCLTIENEWLSTCAVHPGWVQTRMGGNEAPVTPEDSAEGIWKIVCGLNSGNSGKFLDYQGKILPW